MDKDLTIVYYTSNNISDYFARSTRSRLWEAVGDIDLAQLVVVSQRPLHGFGTNICVGDIGRSHLNIYRQALIGAKAAKTKYIALVEDDVIYPKEHFDYRPPDGVFGYNMNVWRLYTWVNPPIFSWKDRFNLHDLICERDLFIEAMEERFNRWPDESKVFIGNWAEPGKYEKNLGVTTRMVEKHYDNVPSVAFSHESGLQFDGMGTKKKLGPIQAYEIPYWNRAENIIKLYNNET